MIQTIRIVQLSGKDYLDANEAAEYMCVSERQFYKIKKAVDLRPLNVFGKLVYKRSHLAHIMEHAEDYDID